MALDSIAMRITDPARFMKEVAGTEGLYETSEISGQLRDLVVTEFTTAVAPLKGAAPGRARNYRQLPQEIQGTLQPAFNEYGLDVTRFLTENISVPPEVEAAID